ncbi:MAG: hypothetical protein MUO51_07430 [Woeseiaceae bacterium]|nr:hypothetical protein [Woeseiaceae bacterium]
MNRLFLLAIIVTAGVVSAQDSSTENETVTESPTPAEVIEAINNEELDSQENHTEEDEDVFKPTDAVSYAQSVPFPVDI